MLKLQCPFFRYYTLDYIRDPSIKGYWSLWDVCLLYIGYPEHATEFSRLTLRDPQSNPGLMGRYLKHHGT